MLKSVDDLWRFNRSNCRQYCCLIIFSQLHQKRWLGSFRGADDSSFPQPVKPFVQRWPSPFPLFTPFLIPFLSPFSCAILLLPFAHLWLSTVLSSLSPLLSLVLHSSFSLVCPHPSLVSISLLTRWTPVFLLISLHVFLCIMTLFFCRSRWCR